LADIYTDAEARGELPFRVVVSHLCKEPPIDDTVAAVTRLRRFATIYRPRALLDTGATIAFGSDWPGAGWFSTYKPLDAIETAVTRQSVGTPDMAVLEPADQRLDLAQALYAATMGPALQLRLDHRVGSIESGKQADLVVLGHNLFDVEAHRIAETPVDMTMMNGRITHSGSLSL
jgi:predicted amidohydrolase YtcJ